MERDKIKNIRYFENYISKEKNDRIERILKLKNNEIKEERIVFVKSFMARDILYSLIAKYSAGYPIEELYTDYYDALEYMRQSWMVLDNRAYLKDTKYNHYFGSDYDLMLWMLSLGYLLDVEKQKYILLLEILDRFSVKDLLYETIIKGVLKFICNFIKIFNQMTLEEYYKAKEKIEKDIPNKLSFSEEMKYYKKELDKLRSQLSPEVLEQVLKNVERFQKKMQSGIS